MPLAGIPWRMIVLAILAACFAWIVGMAYGAGGERARHEAELAQASANAGASEVNAETTNDVAQATDRLGGEVSRTNREAADARLAINAHDTPPPPGLAGKRTRIDPALARIALCRVERVRGLAETPACSSARDPVDAELGNEPVPSRPPARPQ